MCHDNSVCRYLLYAMDRNLNVSACAANINEMYKVSEHYYLEQKIVKRCHFTLTERTSVCFILKCVRDVTRTHSTN